MKKVMFIAIASLGIVILLFGSFYPVGYFDAENESCAGYGHHSFAEIAANGFDWETNTVPVKNQLFEGTGPYVAMPAMWIAMLYIPIMLGIVYVTRLLAILTVDIMFIRPEPAVVS